MRRDENYDDRDIVVREVGGGVGTFLAGVALGAVVALLVAPQSGADTRREIRRRAERARKGAVRVAGDLGDSVKERFRDAREYVEEEIEAAKHIIDEKKRHMTEAVEAGRIAARRTRANLEQRVEENKAAFEAGAETVRARRAAASARGDEAASDG